MGNKILKPWNQIAGRLLAVTFTLGAMLLTVSCLKAETTITTLGGGQPPYFYGNRNGSTLSQALFHTPCGLAIDSTGNYLYVADRDNDAVRVLQFDINYTAPLLTMTNYVMATNLFNKPIGVALDSMDDIFVLNKAKGTNGYVLEFDDTGELIATNLAGITNAGGFALDANDNIYVTSSNTVLKVSSLNGVSSVVATMTASNCLLQGITVKQNGLLAVCDAGRNGILLINPNNGVVTTNAGFHGVGDFITINDFSISNTATFFQPASVVETGNGTLIVSDYGNNRIKAVLPNGVVTNICGVSSNYWGGSYPGWYDHAVVIPDSVAPNAQDRLPNGLAFGPDGSIYVSEDFYHTIRKISGAGLALPPPPPPAVPQDLTATTNYGQIILSWSASTGATNYNIKRSTTSGAETTIASTTGTSYTDTNLLDGTVYFYAVSALNTSGESPNSDEVSAMPLYSPAPTNLTVTATNYGLVSLAWAVSAGANSYNVKRSPSHGGPYSTIASTASTSYNDTGVTNGSTYYYVVSALNTGGESANSTEVSATPPLPPVPDPQIGYVDFPASSTPVAYTSVFHPVSSFVLNNDAYIVIAGAPGSQIYYNYGPTLTNNAPTNGVPDPTSASASSPVGYQDGLVNSQVASYAVAQVLPDLTIRAIGEKNDGSPNSAIVQSRFQFVTANPSINGGNAALFTISDITANAHLYYTLDGSDPSGTNVNAVDLGTLSGTNTVWTLSLFIQTNTWFKVRAFRNNYQPSGVVSNLLTTVAFQPTTITFGTPSGEPHSSFVARPGQFFSAPVTLQLTPGFGKMYSLQFNVGVTNGLSNTHPVIANTNTLSFSSMLMTLVEPTEGKYYPPADGNWYLGIPPIVYSDTNSPPDATTFVDSHNNLLGVGWLYRTGFKYKLTDIAGDVQLDFDTTKQDLIAYSIAHDTLFQQANGLIVVGSYSFQIPANAVTGDQYYIQLGSPSATSDGVGAPGSSIYIQPPQLSQVVTVGSPAYIVGDVAPFHWFNAGDFGDTNLDNSDVMQVYQAAITAVDLPPANSDLFFAMDSAGGLGAYDVNNGYYTNSGTTINVIQQQQMWDGNDLSINSDAFGDGFLDINDLYVTFRRSLDPSLVWFKRYWTNGMFVAVTNVNYSYNSNMANVVTSKGLTDSPKIVGASANYQNSSLVFSAGDAIAGAGNTIQIPINANILGGYPLRVLGLNLNVYPLDGSPAITQQVTFSPSSAIGAPTIASSKDPANFNAAWLNAAIAGLSNNATIGTLTVPLPANATSSSAYTVRFDFASGSPNGIAVFPNQKFNGLITTTSRTNSYYNDSIPDSWRLRWFGTIYNVLSQSNADACGDGISNWNKYIAGVDPTVPNDFPKVNPKSPVPTGYTAAIHWPSVSGKHYVIERSTTLFPGNWSTITTNTGTGGDAEFDDTSTAKAQFYRVLILP